MLEYLEDTGMPRLLIAFSNDVRSSIFFYLFNMCLFIKLLIFTIFR